MLFVLPWIVHKTRIVLEIRRTLMKTQTKPARHTSGATKHPAKNHAGTHVNRDPITTEKGAHPVGVGLGAGASGAVVGAATGAVLGTLAGPVGTAVGGAVGATVGAIAGAYGGREVGEKLNPTTKKARKKLLATRHTRPAKKARAR